MDHDDREQRFSDLERQPAVPRQSAAPAAGGLSAGHIDNVAFSKPPIGKRGYNEDEVDAFLDIVAEHFGSGHGAQPQAGRLTSARHGDGDRWRSVAIGGDRW